MRLLLMFAIVPGVATAAPCDDGWAVPAAAVRTGIQDARLWHAGANGENLEATAGTLELAGGARLESLSLEGVVELSRFGADDQTGTRTVTIGRAGMRALWHNDVLFGGFGVGHTLSSVELPARTEQRFVQDGELIAGATVFRHGDLALQLVGTYGGGEQITELRGLVGLAYEPTPVRGCARVRDDQRIWALRAGVEYTEIVADDAAPEGYGPRIEGELGARVSEHWVLLGTLSYTHFTDDVPAPFGGPTSRYGVTHVRVGGRAQLWLATRLFASFGGGLLVDHESSGATSSGATAPYVELQLGFVLAHVGHYDLEVTDDVGLMRVGDPASGAAGFALGIARR